MAGFCLSGAWVRAHRGHSDGAAARDRSGGVEAGTQGALLRFGLRHSARGNGDRRTDIEGRGTEGIRRRLRFARKRFMPVKSLIHAHWNVAEVLENAPVTSFIRAGRHKGPLECSTQEESGPAHGLAVARFVPIWALGCYAVISLPKGVLKRLAKHKLCANAAQQEQSSE